MKEFNSLIKIPLPDSEKKNLCRTKVHLLGSTTKVKFSDSNN
jgi:hypothetical protein